MPLTPTSFRQMLKNLKELKGFSKSYQKRKNSFCIKDWIQVICEFGYMYNVYII